MWMQGLAAKRVVFVQTECSTQEDLEERETNFTRRNTGKDPLPEVSCGNAIFSLKIASPHETAGSGSFPVFLLVKFILCECKFIEAYWAVCSFSLQRAFRAKSSENCIWNGKETDDGKDMSSFEARNTLTRKKNERQRSPPIGRLIGLQTWWRCHSLRRPVPESAIFGYRRVPCHVPQYPWYRMRALDFALATTPFRGKKVSRSLKLQWLVVVRGETESDRSPCQLQLPQCMNCRLTQAQLVIAAAAATRTSYQWHRGKASNMSDEGPALGEAGFFVRNKKSEWVREREREARQIDKTGVCLIAIKTSKRFAFTASAFRLVSGDFQSSGKGRSYKNW